MWSNLIGQTPGNNTIQILPILHMWPTNDSTQHMFQYICTNLSFNYIITTDTIKVLFRFCCYIRTRCCYSSFKIVLTSIREYTTIASCDCHVIIAHTCLQLLLVLLVELLVYQYLLILITHLMNVR